MIRPTIEEIEKDYKNYLIKLKGYGLCFLAKDDDGEIQLYNKEKTNFVSNSVMALDESLYGYWDEDFRACAIVKCAYEITPIKCVINNDETGIVWDWTDEPVEMTLSEVCKALGKNIKIIKE